MASSSPTSEPASASEENADPSGSTVDDQAGKHNSKNKNRTNQRKKRSDDPESGPHDGETATQGEEVSIRTAPKTRKNKDKDMNQPGSEINPKKDDSTETKSDDLLHENKGRANGKIEQLEEDLTKKDDEINSLKKLREAMKQLEEDLIKKDEEIKSSKAINIMLQDDVQKQVQSKQILEEVHQAKLKQLCSQLTEIENLRCEKDALTESYKKLKSEKDALTENYKKLKSEKDTLTESYKKLKSDRDALTSSHEQLKRDISDTLKKTDATSKEHEKQIKHLKKDLGKEKEEHKADIQAKEKLLKKENEKHQKVVNDLQKQIQSFQNDCTKLREKNDRLSKIEQAYNVTSQSVKSLQSTLSDKEITINRQQSKIHSLQRSIDWYHNENESKHRMIASLEDEKETLLLRLSKITGAQLTYNNPNIADLSDDKRPTKLAEEFSELYDNEWTDAFECIDADNDDKKTKVLYDLLKKAYEFCKTLSTDHDEAIRKSFTTLNYTNSMSSGANEGVQLDASNEIRDSSPDKISENKDLSSPEVKNVAGDGETENVIKTLQAQEDTDSGVIDTENCLNKAERYENDQHEKTSGDLEKDKNTKPSDKTSDGGVKEPENVIKTTQTQEDTSSRNMDTEKNLNEAERYENDQHKKTRDELEKDKHTNPFDQVIEEISENYVQSSPEAKTDAGDGEVAKTENVIKTTQAQDDTDSGIVDREKNLNVAERYENDEHEKTRGGMEKDENKNPSDQVINSGDPDGIKALDKSGVSGEEPPYVSVVESSNVDNIAMHQKEVKLEKRTIQTARVSNTQENKAETTEGKETTDDVTCCADLEDPNNVLANNKLKDNEQDASKIHVNTEFDDYVHISTEGTIINRRINDENSSSAKHLKEGKDNSVGDKKQIKVSELTFKFDDLSAEQKKTIMDLRKLCEEKQTNDVVQVGSKLIAEEMQIENGEIMKYISKCIDICWSMRRHTPPVYMDYSKSEEGLPFDKQKYRPYTKSGKFVRFVVWPVLYLHEGGPQLSKGVAQGKD